ncbi:BMP family lipoprotein [Natranaerobius thermophilus]|uniref:Basic membrane lipoprotein n=1 Tax=Natranaerobius thermophilus (strain ATCC BAA-1301 / DSM 18059 / JW/NM-WN-LF) TaxID=457570 RepID=B2A5S3_NATTJ|nr:basic membrane lipoprotein [Natranaerobius thermophilus JW/NM-WN-LF]
MLSKKFLAILMAGMLVFVFAACGTDEDPAEDPENGENGEAAEEEEDVPTVGIVFSTGGLGDQSFNDSAYRGMEMAEEEFDFEWDYIEPENPADFDPALTTFAEDEVDLLIGVGFQMEAEVKEIAENYPDMNVAIVDHSYEEETPENLEELVFDEPGGSFLAGALAAKVTETDVVGFVGGVNGPLIHRFEGGFVQGVQYVDEDIEILGSYADSFGDPARGTDITEGFVDQGADVIYHAAGGTGDGVFTIASDYDNVYAIGVDDNQNHIQPGHIIASMLKRVDVAVYETVQRVVEDEFEGGITREFSLEDDGVGLSSLDELDVQEKEAVELDAITEEELELIKEMKEEITAEHADQIEQIKQDIIDDEIEVEDWMETGRQDY